MTTNQDALDAYKKAIRVKFESERDKEFSSFLIVPSRAKLRQLCFERFKSNNNLDDLKSFEIFFGFEFNSNTKNKLQAATDKFRPIEKFLKGETDLADYEGINIAAVLVDFNPRPFKKFAKMGFEYVESEIINTSSGEIAKEESEDLRVSEGNTSFGVLKKTINKKVGIGLLVVLSSIGIKQAFFKEKECMQWQGDHYEVVHCDVQGIGGLASVEPVRKEVLKLKQIAVCDTTTFFKEGKAIVWYCKVGANPEFFNTHGIHPETGKALRPVTKYIIKKYVLNQNH